MATPDRPAASVRERALNRANRWLGRRVELLARRVGYHHIDWLGGFDLRYHVLDPVSDRLYWAASMRTYRRLTRGR